MNINAMNNDAININAMNINAINNDIMNTNKVVELLKVYLNTKGDFRSTKPVPFMNKGLILFTTKVFLDPKILKGNNISVRQVFLNYEVFYNAVRLLKSASYANYTPMEIQKNNLEVFRKEFLNEKMVIPINNTQMSVIKSTYVANSFKPAVSPGLPKTALQYEVKFDVTILNAVRNLNDGDFKRANCKIKAFELNKQAKELFNIDLDLDDEFPPIKRSILTPQSGNINSPYGNSNSPYGNINSPYGNSNSPYGNSTNNELAQARREISLLLKELEKTEDMKAKEHYTTEWLNYKDQRKNEGLPVVPMAEWIADRERTQFLNKYKNEWLKYKQEQEFASKQPDVDKWRKNKAEEELVNASDFFAKKWITYRNEQTVIGKKPVLQDWLKSEVQKYKKRDPIADGYMYLGGRTKKYTRINKRHKKYKKKTLKKRAKTRRYKR